jgi:hypothetical protein
MTKKPTTAVNGQCSHGVFSTGCCKFAIVKRYQVLGILHRWVYQCLLISLLSEAIGIEQQVKTKKEHSP